MMIRTNINEALRSLLASKQRTLLALLGIVIGIGSVIALVSTATIAQNETMKQFLEMGTDVIRIQHEQARGQAPEDQGFRFDQAMGLPLEVDAVTEVAPFVSFSGQLRIHDKRIPVIGAGVTGSFASINKLQVAEGRFISDLDYLMYQAVISGGLASKLRQQGIYDLVGSTVYLQNRLFTIVGELQPAASGVMRSYEGIEGILIPISTATRMNSQNRIRSLMATKHPDAAHDQVEAAITTYFQGFPRPTRVVVRSAEQIIEQMEKQMRLFTLLLGSIGSISLVVGGVGVMNVMLVSVSERKKEIGIRRALGARKKDIQSQFLMESIVLSLIGGVLGIIIGVGISYAIAHFSGWEFEIIYQSLLVGVGVSAAVGIFFGFYPARQAANLIPIQALRSS